MTSSGAGATSGRDTSGSGEAVTAVIFDWGGTLTPHADVDLLDLWRAAANHLDPARADELAARLGAVEDAFWARTSASQLSGTLDDIIAMAAQELGLDIADAVREEAASRHLDAWASHICHEPDAAPTLQALRERGLRIGLLSNTHWPRAFHEHMLERDGLSRLIDARLYTSELTYLKPHPAVFKAALAALGDEDQPVAPARAVFVGDRPRDDIAGAKSVGMRAVLKPNAAVPTGPVEPDARVATLAALVPLIDGWL